MGDVARDNRVISMCGKAGMKSQLTGMLDQLQRCQKALNEFLEVNELELKINQALSYNVS